MSPLEYYQKKIASGEILPDPQQMVVMQRCETLYQQLLTERGGWLSRWRHKTPPRGLYLWGSVGIGKTFLLDTFYYCLPFTDKLRSHFYAFMRAVHAELQTLQGSKNPLQQLAKNWAEKARIICLDELLVHDIADAMVLGNLFTALFQQGVCLMFSANIAPDDLYHNGLQRELFLPAIAQIKAHTEVIHLCTSDDYRAHSDQSERFYWYPLTTAALTNLARCFAHYAEGQTVTDAPLSICHRDIAVIKRAETVVWFDFMAICGKPRSQEDYLALVQQFRMICISNVPAISPKDSDLARSFIRFIDVLYDAKVRLALAAALPIEQLYTAGDLIDEFARTRSRLLQMQSAQWGI